MSGRAINWYLQRITGAALLLLLIMHFWVEHFTAEVRTPAGLTFEVIQRRFVQGGGGYPSFTFRGGATIIFGGEGEVRYVIAKSVKSETRLMRQRDYTMNSGGDVFALDKCRHELGKKRPPRGPAGRGKVEH